MALGRSAWLLLVTSACAPKVQVEVLQPAAVTFPAGVRRVAIIDRSAPQNTGEVVLSTLEGAATGEAIMGDREGASKAMEGVVATVEASPRFDAVVPIVTTRESETDIWDSTLSWKAAERICAKVNAQALVALEAFDTDSTLDMSTSTTSEVVNGQTVDKIVHHAERETRILTAWRVYDVNRREIIDDVREYQYTDTWTETGDTPSQAVQKLPSQVQTVMTLGERAGVEYGRRIAPSYVMVSRAYYGSGNDRMKESKVHVKSGDWDGASEIWTHIVENQPDAKIRGKAEFNLALYHEIQGDLDGAHEWAKKAGTDLQSGRAYRYSAVLAKRIEDQKLLEQQLRAPEKRERPQSDPGTATKDASPDSSTEQKDRPRDASPDSGDVQPDRPQ